LPDLTVVTSYGTEFLKNVSKLYTTRIGNIILLYCHIKCTAFFLMGFMQCRPFLIKATRGFWPIIEFFLSVCILVINWATFVVAHLRKGLHFSPILKN
jgi:hypothetical protein